MQVEVVESFQPCFIDNGAAKLLRELFGEAVRRDALCAHISDLPILHIHFEARSKALVGRIVARDEHHLAVRAFEFARRLRRLKFGTVGVDDQSVDRKFFGFLVESEFCAVGERGLQHALGSGFFRT